MHDLRRLRGLRATAYAHSLRTTLPVSSLRRERRSEEVHAAGGGDVGRHTGRLEIIDRLIQVRYQEAERALLRIPPGEAMAKEPPSGNLKRSASTPSTLI